ncbi:MAG TPA: hypothetical protein VGC24_05510 [Burkholderiaceae bacterium]
MNPGAYTGMLGVTIGRGRHAQNRHFDHRGGLRELRLIVNALVRPAVAHH